MPTRTVARLILFAGCAALLAGCHRAPLLQFESSAEVKALGPEAQKQVREILEKHCGTPANPRMLGDEKFPPERLKRGALVYQQRCVHCHGVSGDGAGPAAAWLNPKPRDYRRGKFKFTTTPYDAKPRREDLVRTVRNGIIGTSMPAFNLLSEKEIDAVVDYVLALTHRGELEIQLAAEAEASEKVDPELIPDLVSLVLDPWKDADANAVSPLTPAPIFTAEHVAAGKQAFLTRGCSKCHGEDGRGQTPDNLRGDLKDFWGHPTKAADLTSGMLRGGRRPEDIYRRIYSGINGTPMPSFQSVLANEPETYWNLVAYVLYVSNRRRAGNVPEAGLLSLPAPAAESNTATGGE